jgi:D-threonate/D-erythronate kinase
MTRQPQLRILADDLTGALDSAAAFDGEVPVYLDAPPPMAAAARVSVVATATRDIAPDALDFALAPSLPWLADAAVAFKKVDSLLRGNTFAECAHVAAAGGFDRLVFAPAYPKQGRLAIGGRAVVMQPGDAGATPRPIGERSIAESFAALPAALTNKALTKSAPMKALRTALTVPDVHSDDDLLRLARGALQPASGERVLWCGSAGLAQALATVLGWRAAAAPATAAASAPCLLPYLLPCVLVSASQHPVVRGQWQRLAAAEPSAVYSGRGEGLALDAALTAMQQPTFDLALLDLSPAQPLSTEQAAALLAQQIDAIAQRAPRPGTLLVIGGDTLRALCRATGAYALVARAGLREGWGCARLVGGVWDGITCHSRSGAFGPPDDLVSMATLRARITRRPQ